MDINKRFEQEANPKKAEILQRFFKTKPGEYGEGDVFLGITVPKTRQIAKEFKHLSMDEIDELLSDKVHEKRLVALLILVERFEKGDEKTKKQIFDYYLKNASKVNNWDLVDLTAGKIVGNYLLNKPEQREILYNLANSNDLWEKRIAIISTFTFIRNNQFEDIIKISQILLSDKHDLMHKAVGWMLRELGKRNQIILEDFLKENYKLLPRTTLRYAIERFEESKRKKYLKGDFN